MFYAASKGEIIIFDDDDADDDKKSISMKFDPAMKLLEHSFSEISIQDAIGKTKRKSIKYYGSS